jgi:hypothetical protein
VPLLSIPVDSGAIPADSSGMAPFLQECVGHDKVLMAGHTAIFGDRFSTAQGAKSSHIKGAKSQYYPMDPPENDLYNPSRPPKYALLRIPMRSQATY